MAKPALLTTKSETSFQSLILAIYHLKINPNQDAHQTAIKMLQENWWNAIHAKVLKN